MKINESDIIIISIHALQLLASNNWKRPVYFVNPVDKVSKNLSSYLKLEGLVYRLVPYKTDSPLTIVDTYKIFHFFIK